VEDGQQALEDECLRAEESALDLAVLSLGGAGGSGHGAAALFAALFFRRFGEEDEVLAWGVVGGEVGG